MFCLSSESGVCIDILDLVYNQARVMAYILVLVELQKFMYDLSVGGWVLVGYVAGQWGNFLPSALVHVWIV